jgi:hypothetical protein
VEWQYAQCHRRGDALYRCDTEEAISSQF